MFIETLEFTIPVDLCDLFNSLKRGPKSNLEFPASVNSYGTTQDANIQVVLRSNKLTFKVDGVSSNSSMISKSECKTLKLSIFDVDCTPLSDQDSYEDVSQSVPYINPAKRSRPMPMRSPPAKNSRTSFSESSVKSQQSSNQSQVRIDTESVNVKQEPDLIEIEPDPDPYEEDSGSNRLTSQSALDRLSHTQSSTSSSSSFHQNVPHVPDYAEPGPSQSQHGDQSEDYLVYQDPGDNDYDDDDNDNSGNFGNDGCRSSVGFSRSHLGRSVLVQQDDIKPSVSGGLDLFCRTVKSSVHYISPDMLKMTDLWTPENQSTERYPCSLCDKSFLSNRALQNHIATIHDNVTFDCKCGKSYKSRNGLWLHRKKCCMYLSDQM